MADETSYEDYQNSIISDMRQRIEVAETMKKKMLAVLDETLCCVAVEKTSKKQAWVVEWAIEMSDAPFMQPAAAEEPDEVQSEDEAAAGSGDAADKARGRGR